MGEPERAAVNRTAIEDQRLRAMVESSPMGMHFYRLEPGNRLVFVGANPAADRLLGVENAQFVGKTIEEAFPPLASTEIPARYREVAATGAHWDTEQVEYRDDRIVGAFEVHAFRIAPLEMVATFLDVTKRKQTEDRLRQAEKLQAIGQIAGGVAHDFNNQLTGILGNAAFLHEALPDRPDLAEAASEIRDCATRSARLTAQLLAFARKGAMQSMPVDAHEVIRDVVALLGRSIDRRIVLTTALAAAQHTVRGDPSQFHGALLNLGLNARDAMPDGGELTFATGNTVLDPARREALGIEGAAGPMLRIEVCDTGSGIDPAIRTRIFEPFFTTKAPGKGSGLGLSAVYGTARALDGAVEVQSAPGRGSTFTLWLPVHSGEKPEGIAREEKSPPTRKARILVVDDEELVRSLLTRVLGHLGHQATFAARGEEAVAIFERERGQFDLVLLDMVLPDLTGEEVFRRLIAIDPAVRVVISSGRSMDGVADDLRGASRTWTLQKPYTPRAVSQVIDEALASQR